MAKKRGYSKMWFVAVTAVATAGFSVAVMIAKHSNSNKSSNSGSTTSVRWNVPTWFYILSAVLIALVVVGFSFYLMITYRQDVEARSFERKVIEREQQAFESAVERLREKMALPSLIELNRIMLEQYHKIATDQAEKSFKSSHRAMWLGFLLIAACFGVAVFLSGDQIRIFLGALAAIGGALSGYLSRTYLRVYDRSLEQLNRYFNQPLLNSYYLTAERIAGDISELEKDKMLAQIVERLLCSADDAKVLESASRFTKKGKNER